MNVPDNSRAPHRAVIFLSAEVHELLPTGECSGNPVSKTAQFPMYLDGLDRDLTIRMLADLITELKAKCKQTHRG